MTEYNQWFDDFAALPDEELDKLALLRIVECTNGLIQYAYRDSTNEALSIEETRRAMEFSMGSIKKMQIELENETIEFADDTKELMTKVRDKYVSGMKHNNDADYAEFLVASLACFRACGLERLEQAQTKLYSDCYQMPSHTWSWGLEYARNFMAANE